MATKRKHSFVEVATVVKCKHCFFCKSKGHDRQGCNWAKSKGQRLAARTWYIISYVPKSHDVISYDCVNTVVPSEAMGLQIIDSLQLGDMEYFKAVSVLLGLHDKNGCPGWYSRGLVNDWAKVGKSSAHFVFLHHFAS